ncbi:MAG TPA: FtsX-like permease family protein [Acidiferrobacterales bacterium]|nr:FtsX-like permease family protein [Acidiferrobacterales bacterium]
MGILLRLAWRNLWRHKRRTWLTASAIAFAAMLLVFMITLQLGAYDMMIDVSLRVFTGQMQVQREGYKDKPQMRSTVPAAAALAAQLRTATGLDAVAVRAQGFALASSATRSYGVPVIGVEPEHEARVSTLPHLIRDGRYLSVVDAQEVVLGAALARNLKVRPGDELTLLGSGKDGSIAATIIPVAGIFESGNPDLDRRLVHMPLKTFQEVFSMGDDAHAIVVSGPDYESIPQTMAAVNAQLAPGSGLVVLDWEQLIPGLRQLIQTDMVQNWIIYIALILIVTLSIMNTFLMSVLERTREFGIMLALGVSPRQIGVVVLLESAFLTTLGLAIGMAIGGGIAVYLHFTGFTFPGMEELYAQFGLPGVIHPKLSFAGFTLGPAVIFVFTMLAAIYPALRIRKLQPVEAIHAV